MSWNLRQTLPRDFGLAMNDADAMTNARLHEYEDLQFLNPNPDKLVAIEKTQVQGDLYDTISMGDHSVVLRGDRSSSIFSPSPPILTTPRPSESLGF